MRQSDASNASPAPIGLLTSQLSSKDMGERMRARESLVKMGAVAIPAVAVLADTEDDHTRWECAKILAAIADASSIDILIRLLEDSEEGVRWNAAMGLIAIGQPAVIPLLHALIRRSVDYTILDGARHVIHEFSKAQWGDYLRPLYKALSGSPSPESTSVAATRVLQQQEYGDLSR